MTNQPDDLTVVFTDQTSVSNNSELPIIDVAAPREDYQRIKLRRAHLYGGIPDIEG